MSLAHKDLRKLYRMISVLMAGFLLFGCSENADPDSTRTEAVDASKPGDEVDGQVSETQRLYAFFDQAFEEDLARSPMLQSYLGIKTDYAKWDDLSDIFAAESYQIKRDRLAALSGFDVDNLEPQARLSLRLFEAVTRQDLDAYRWRHYDYPVNQMFGWQQRIPSFLINIHRVSSEEDARAYIARLNGVDELSGQIISQMRMRESKGVMPPRFVYPLIIEAAENVLTGMPFEEGEQVSTLWEDFTGKISALELDEERSEQLLQDARTALVDTFQPAWKRLINEMRRQYGIATTDDGVWKLPDGGDFYTHQLQLYTTTDLSADDIHRIGLENVARIHDEMREIMEQVGFEGSLADFFQFMRDDARFYYENTDEDRARYLTEATAIIDRMRERLPDVFGIFPEASLQVKAVEPFRERSAGKAFYQQPALDGSRPGTYYANLYDMRDMPTYQMEALAYHEGIPGHHMQIAIAQELDDVPKFQRLASFTAYVEGWGLYSEYLPKEMGFYADPYSDFGRLAMELWRACRLVVDTGIHHMRWTREEAIDYLRENTPNPEGDIVKAIERYIVFPGQATAYMIGKQKILELREKAKDTLGAEFHLSEFHDEVLKDGPVPLDILDEKISNWVSEKRMRQSGQP